MTSTKLKICRYCPVSSISPKVQVFRIYNFVFGANFRHLLCFPFFGAQETLKMHSLIFIFILDKTYECMWLSYLQKRFKDFLCHQKIGKKAYVIMKLRIVSFIVWDNSKCTAKCKCTRKNASSNTFCLEAHLSFFRLLMKGIFCPYVLWPFDKKLIV